MATFKIYTNLGVFVGDVEADNLIKHEEGTTFLGNIKENEGCKLQPQYDMVAFIPSNFLIIKLKEINQEA